MDKYYYLISSLSSLKFTEAPLISKEDFIVEAEKWLKSTDFLILSAVEINDFLEDGKDIPLLKRYKEFERCLREELAFFRRAKRKNIEYKVRKDLNSIIQEDNNPLEIERKLLFLRWNFLEEQEVGHFFDLEFLIIYYLKLQILERLISFNKEKGKERLEAISLVK